MAVPYFLGGINPLPVERRGHTNIGHQDVRCAGEGLLNHFVVVGRHADHPEVRVPGNEGPDPLAHDQIVVGQKDVDRARGVRGG
jgi:hypothetical protein